MQFYQLKMALSHLCGMRFVSELVSDVCHSTGTQLVVVRIRKRLALLSRPFDPPPPHPPTHTHNRARSKKTVPAPPIIIRSVTIAESRGKPVMHGNYDRHWSRY